MIMMTVGFRPLQMHFPSIFNLMSPDSIPWARAVTLLPDYGKETGKCKGSREQWGHWKQAAQLEFSQTLLLPTALPGKAGKGMTVGVSEISRK
jgi:hypothetical protein